MRLLHLLSHDLRIITLSPVHREYGKEDQLAAIQMWAECMRAHEESRMKSERVGAAWSKKRQAVIEGQMQPQTRQSTVGGTAVLTHNLPAWVEEREGKMVLNPERVALVRRMFDLALAGYGTTKIAVKFNEEGVPVMGREEFQGKKVVWNTTVIHHILSSRSTFGEYQPHQGTHKAKNRKPVGDPIKGYYPAAVSEDIYHATQAALKSRSKRGAGRRGNYNNLLSGLLIDARDGGTMSYYHPKGYPSVIIPVKAKKGGGGVFASFPAVPLELALRSKLREIPASEINGTCEASRRVETLSGQLADAVKIRGTWQAKMDNPDIADLVEAKLAELNPKCKRLAAELASAQAEAASPVSEAWGEFRTLAKMPPEDDTDDLRTRIKHALRRCITGIYCLFLGRGITRLAAVQVRFTNETQRSYVIVYRPKHGGQAASWLPKSFADAGLPGTLDLRNADHVAAVEKLLLAIDPGILDAPAGSAAKPASGKKKSATPTKGKSKRAVKLK